MNIPVWRRVLIDGSSTLEELHYLIVNAMGWFGDHIHEFNIKEVSYGIPNPDYEEEVLEEEKFTLGSVCKKTGDTFLYTYDFSDDWEHHVVVEKIIEPEEGVKYPCCIGGERACPLDECGGAHGYAQLLEKLSNPSLMEYEEYTALAREIPNPRHFSIADANARIHEQITHEFDEIDDLGF